VRWTLEDKATITARKHQAEAAAAAAATSGNGEVGNEQQSQQPQGQRLLYHGKPLAHAPGTAYVLMVPNRSSTAGGKDGGKGGGRKQIFVVPIGPWIGYHRVADAVDVPSSVKEAEAMMKAGGGGGAGGGKGRGKKEEEEEQGEEKLTRRELLERFLTKSRGILDEGGKVGGKVGGKGGKQNSSSGGGLRGRKGVKMERSHEEGRKGREGPGRRRREGGLGGVDGDIGDDDLAQNADSRELIGLGSDNEVSQPSLPSSLPPSLPPSLFLPLSLFVSQPFPLAVCGGT